VTIARLGVAIRRVGDAVRSTRLVVARWIGAVGARRWRLVGATAATVLTAATLSLTWLPDDTWAGTVPSTAQVVGTCHAYDTEIEQESFSDVRPPVPCDRPHQAETVSVGRLTGDLDTATRMTPEQRLILAGQLCPDSVIRRYVGARPRDELYGVVGVVRLPTEREWAQGDREYRCELVTTDQDGPPRISALTMSLRNVLNTPLGAQVRHCWLDFTTSVSCDRPHRSESVWGIATTPQWIVDFGSPTSFTIAQYQQFQQWAGQNCTDTVTQFLGRPVDRTLYHIDGHLSPDAKVLWCAVAVPDSQRPITGSIAREIP
jgi:hypothetical protein